MLSSLVSICVAVFSPSEPKPQPRTSYQAMQHLETLVQAGEYQISGSRLYIHYVHHEAPKQMRRITMVIERQDPPAVIILEAPDFKDNFFAGSDQFLVEQAGDVIAVYALSIQGENDPYSTSLIFELEQGRLKRIHLVNRHLRESLRGQASHVLITEIKGQVESGPQ